jgi:S1-C subfamily serine protease
MRAPAGHRCALLAAVAVSLALVVAVAGCGGGGGDESGGKPTRVELVQSPAHRSDFDPAAIFKQFSDGVVTLTSLFGNAGAKDLGSDAQAGQGSGFVLNKQGFIATNAHVVTNGRGDGITKAREVFAQFADGDQVPAEIVGFDPNADVALVKVNPKGLDLVPLALGRSSTVRVGDPVAAIGSPFGEEQSLSVGVVSATNRTIEALTDFEIGNAVQTDAAINRGNSGGPLLNARGEVIGINSQIKSSGGGGEGVGFAVSVDTVRRSIDQLRNGGKAHYGYIGVSSQSLYPQLARKLGLPVDDGALVADVVGGGPADKAGIKGGGKEIRFQTSLIKPGGDVITRVNGHPITRDEDLSDLITRYAPGDTVTLEVYRGDQRREVKVTLTDRPEHLPG